LLKFGKKYVVINYAELWQHTVSSLYWRVCSV